MKAECRETESWETMRYKFVNKYMCESGICVKLKGMFQSEFDDGGCDHRWARGKGLHHPRRIRFTDGPATLDGTSGSFTSEGDIMGPPLQGRVPDLPGWLTMGPASENGS